MEITEQVKVMERQYNAVPILLTYIRKMAAKGDQEAVKILIRWDKARNYRE